MILSNEHKHLNTIKKLLKTSNKVVKDECDDPCIFGRKGKIYTDLQFWYIYLVSRNWESFKKELDFMEVWQDGDQEGVLRADFPPSPEQAIVIRRIVGLGKKRISTQKNTEHLQKFMFKPRHPEVLQASRIDLNRYPATLVAKEV